MWCSPQIFNVALLAITHLGSGSGSGSAKAPTMSTTDRKRNAADSIADRTEPASGASVIEDLGGRSIRALVSQELGTDNVIIYTEMAKYSPFLKILLNSIQLWGHLILKIIQVGLALSYLRIETTA